MNKTINKNDIIELEITAISNDGSGLARVQGLVVFVPYSAIGDKLKVKVLKVKSSLAYGKIEEILIPSPDRWNPDCKAFYKCGGCELRHIKYTAELIAKESFIKDAFTKIGKLSPEFLPIIPNENVNAYRNKVQYPIGKNKDGKIIYGFYRSNSHDIVSCPNCIIEPNIFREIANFIIAYAEKARISIYNETEHKGVLRHIYIRKGHYSGEISVTLVARRKIPELLPLAHALKKEFPQIEGVVLNLNKDKTNVVLGDEEIILYGKPEIIDTMCGLEIELSPKSFYQINTPAAEKLYAAARAFAEPKGKTILDLYCGVGTIGLSMASEAKEIIGIEIVPEAIENAKNNTKRNNIENASFICADAEIGTEEITRLGKKIDIVILDPARKGCSGKTLEMVASLTPDKIVMISCNPATAARDCARLEMLGYKTEKVQGADLFSGTRHVECVVLMSRVEK